MDTTVDTDQIAHIKKLRADLYTVEKKQFDHHLIMDKKSFLKLEREFSQNENTNLVVLVATCCIMLLFILSGKFIQADMSSKYISETRLANPDAKIDCHQHDNQFDECVAGQRSGNGCSWYADCNKCIHSSEVNTASICAKN